MSDHRTSTHDDAQPATGPEARDSDELRRTREAQEAHGGSMAPPLVDETGHPVGDTAATGADPAAP